MSVYTIEVGVALRRPPRVDQLRQYRVSACSGREAELTALQWAAGSPGVVMPVSSLVVDW